jgi:hypothetical protein
MAYRAGIRESLHDARLVMMTTRTLRFISRSDTSPNTRSEFRST